MPPTNLYPLSYTLSRSRPDEYRRTAGGDRVRCHQPLRSLSPVQWLAISALPLLAALWAGAAHGQSLTVQATVVGACTAQSGTLNFGQYVTGQTSPVGTNTAFIVNCPAGVGVTVKLGPGNNANQTDRGMTRVGSSDVLRYNLYLTDQFSQVWGDGTFGQAVRSISSFDTSNGAQQVVHGRIPGGQAVGPGDYSDQVTITVDLTPSS